MFNFMIRVIACFIFNREKRKAFRRLWLNFPKRLLTRQGCEERLLARQNESEEMLRLCIRRLHQICRYDILCNFGIDRYKTGDEQHQKNVTQLLINLSDEAKSHLLRILDRMDKIYYNGAVPINRLYDEEELKRLDIVNHFSREIREIPNATGGGVSLANINWRCGITIALPRSCTVMG